MVRDLVVRLTYQKRVVVVNNIILRLVKCIPEELEENVLYVSKEFGTASHLCGCGCKTEIVTPIGDNWWTFHENCGLFSLTPSVGNYQIPCKSHYFITNNQFVMC